MSLPERAEDPTTAPTALTCQDGEVPPVPRPVTRGALIVAGWAFTAIAAVGAVLPLLPGTPLLLLAAFCFARSSPRLHRALRRSALFGPVLRSWEESRSVPRTTKWMGVTLIVLGFSVSIFLVRDHPPLAIGLAVVGLAVATFVARLPTRSRSPD